MSYYYDFDYSSNLETQPLHDSHFLLWHKCTTVPYHSSSRPWIGALLVSCAVLGLAAVPTSPSNQAVSLQINHPWAEVSTAVYMPSRQVQGQPIEHSKPDQAKVSLGVSAIGATSALLAQGLSQLPTQGPRLIMADSLILNESVFLLLLFTPLVVFFLWTNNEKPSHSLQLAFAGPTVEPVRGMSTDEDVFSPTYLAMETSRVSPFESTPVPAGGTGVADIEDGDPPDILTEANVERVLNELRPYLIADGGNVELVEIDGLVVYLKLKGACGSCASSAVTMAMGIKKRLMEAIPEIESIEEIREEQDPGMALTVENVEKVLAEIRPFLSGAGEGDVRLDSIDGSILNLVLDGPIKSIMTIRVAIVTKLRDAIPSITMVKLL